MGSLTSLFAMMGRGALSGSMGGAGNMVSMVTGLTTRLTSALWEGLGKVLGLITGSLRGVLSIAARLPGVVLTGLTKITDGAEGALSASARAIAFGLRSILTGAVAALTVAVGGLVVATTRAVSITRDWARNINALSGGTGLSSRAAGGLQGRFGAFGQDASRLFENQNPWAFGMRASAFGLPNYTNSQFLPQLAGRYQGMMASGPMGQMLGRAQLQAMGLDNREMRGLLTTPVADIQGQLGFQSRVQSGLGIDPTTVANLGRQFELLSGRFKMLGEGALTRLAIEILPRLNGMLDATANYLANNAGQISNLITQAVTISINALVALATVLVSLPDAALTFADTMLAGLSAVIGAVPGLWESFLTGISIVQAAVDPLFSTIVQGFDYVAQTVPGVIESFNFGVETLLTMLQTGIGTTGSVVVTMIGAIQTALNSLLRSQFVQAALKSLPAVAQIGGALHQATAGGANAGQSLGTALGGDSWGGVGYLAGGYLMGKTLLGGAGKLIGVGARGLWGLGGRAVAGIGGLFGGGAAAGAAGAAGGQLVLPGMGAAAASAWPTLAGMASAVSAPVIGAGIGLGVAGYEGLRALNMGPWKNLPSSGAILGHYLGMGGNPAAQAAAASGAPYQVDFQSTLNSMTGAWNQAAAHPGSWARDYRGLPGRATLMAQGAMSGVSGWIGGAVEQGTRERGSWAHSADNRLGNPLRDLTADAQRELAQARAILKEKRDEADGSDLKQVLNALLQEMKGVNANTKQSAKSDQVLPQYLQDFAAKLLGHALHAMAQNSALADMSVG
jgi:hypothetical protein